eukprot:tig00000681_g3130.t1
MHVCDLCVSEPGPIGERAALLIGTPSPAASPPAPLLIPLVYMEPAGAGAGMPDEDPEFIRLTVHVLDASRPPLVRAVRAARSPHNYASSFDLRAAAVLASGDAVLAAGRSEDDKLVVCTCDWRGPGGEARWDFLRINVDLLEEPDWAGGAGDSPYDAPPRFHIMPHAAGAHAVVRVSSPRWDPWAASEEGAPSAEVQYFLVRITPAGRVEVHTHADHRAR